MKRLVGSSKINKSFALKLVIMGEDVVENTKTGGRFDKHKIEVLSR